VKHRRNPAAHCPTCYCDAALGRVDRDAPFYDLVEECERAWSELMLEDRLAGRTQWRPGSRSAA